MFRAAALTLRTVLLSLQALLSAAEPDDPQDAVVARQYKENRKIFTKTAQFWAQHYAQGKQAYIILVREYVCLQVPCDDGYLVCGRDSNEEALEHFMMNLHHLLIKKACIPSLQLPFYSLPIFLVVYIVLFSSKYSNSPRISSFSWLSNPN